MSSPIESTRRRLLHHGSIFLFLALWLGLGIVALPHPRAWLTAHLTAFLTGLILIAIGMVWRELRLTERQRTVALACGYVSAYSGLAANVFSAIVDMPGPASQPGVTAPNPQAAIFFTLLAIVVPTTLTAFGMVAYGLRGEP